MLSIGNWIDVNARTRAPGDQSKNGSDTENGRCLGRIARRRTQQGNTRKSIGVVNQDVLEARNSCHRCRHLDLGMIVTMGCCYCFIGADFVSAALMLRHHGLIAVTRHAFAAFVFFCGHHGLGKEAGKLREKRPNQGDGQGYDFEPPLHGFSIVP